MKKALSFILTCLFAVAATWLFSTHYYAGKICTAAFASFNPQQFLVSHDIDDDDPEGKAIGQMMTGDIEQAVQTFEQLYHQANTVEDKIEYGTLLAYAYIKAHKLGKAKKLLYKLLQVDPDNKELQALYESLKGIYLV